MRLVSIEMLQPEMKIARAVYNQGTLVLPEGRGNVAKYIPNLRNMGIEYVYVEDNKSEGIEIPDAIAERTRTSCKQILQNTMQQFSVSDKLETRELEACVNSVISEILKNLALTNRSINLSDTLNFLKLSNLSGVISFPL